MSGDLKKKGSTDYYNYINLYIKSCIGYFRLNKKYHYWLLAWFLHFSIYLKKEMQPREKSFYQHYNNLYIKSCQGLFKLNQKSFKCQKALAI